MPNMRDIENNQEKQANEMESKIKNAYKFRNSEEDALLFLHWLAGSNIIVRDYFPSRAWSNSLQLDKKEL